MDLSLIISTRNRSESLLRTLRCIEQLQSEACWELVVVDNGSTDNSGAVLRTFAQDSSVNVVIVDEATPGLANARNAGVRSAKGNILVFTDDDCLPAGDFIEQAIAVFAEDESIGFSGGRILLHDPTDQPITIQESTERELIAPGQFVEAGLIQGANFAFRRAALIASGAFDPFFGAGSYYAVEDIDAVARVSAMGWHGVYDPRPLVYHHHGRKTAADADALESSYAHGRGAYYVKCMLGKQWSAEAWKQWYWATRRKTLLSLRREFAGGVSFFFRSVWDRGRRFRNLNFQESE